MGRTGHSTLRRSLAGLLHASGVIGPLQAQPRNLAKPERFASFALDGSSDERLQAWIEQHLRVGWWTPGAGFDDAAPTPPLKDLERGLLAHPLWASSPPPLNLKDLGGTTTTTVRRIKAARKVLADQARAFGGGDGAGGRTRGGERADDARRYDLLDLFRAEERCRPEPHRAPRRDALTAALGIDVLVDMGPHVDVDHGSGRHPDDLSADDAFAWFLRGTVARLDAAQSPFDGLLEAPMPVVELYARHAERLRDLAPPWRAALRSLVFDGLASRYGVPADATTTERGVRDAEDARGGAQGEGA